MDKWLEDFLSIFQHTDRDELAFARVEDTEKLRKDIQLIIMSANIKKVHYLPRVRYVQTVVDVLTKVFEEVLVGELTEETELEIYRTINKVDHLDFELQEYLRSALFISGDLAKSATWHCTGSRDWRSLFTLVKKTLPEQNWRIN